MISIIVPVYNVESYLQACVDSILAQTFRDFELILVDDGSSDYSAEICRRYAERDRRVIFLQIPESGVSAARNTGLGEARGEYISFVDADDWLSPVFYEKMMRCAGRGADIICCDYKIATQLDSAGHRQADSISRRQEGFAGQDHFRIENAKTWRKAPPVFQVKGKNKYNAVFARSPYVWNKIFTRRAIGRIRFPESLEYGEDMIFLLEVLKHSEACRILNRPLYYYRKNREGSITKDADRIRDYRYLLALQRAYWRMRNTEAGAAGVSRLTNGSMAVLRKQDSERIPPEILWQIRCGTGMVSRRDRHSFLAEPSFSLKEKTAFVLLRGDPRIAMICRQAVNALRS